MVYKDNVTDPQRMGTGPRYRYSSGVALTMAAGAVRAADCTATLTYAPFQAAAVPGLSDPLALGLMAAGLLALGWTYLRGKQSGKTALGRRAGLFSGLVVVVLASSIYPQPWAQAVSILLDNPNGGSVSLLGTQATTVTNSSGVALSIDLAPGVDTTVLTPSSTCSAGQSLQPGQSCTVSLGGACVVPSGFTISGNVFNDINGLTDNTVNQSAAATYPVPTGLYASVVDGNGNVVGSAAVDASGSYSVINVADGTYSVVLSTTQGVVGSAAPTVSVPSGWVNTGEGLGANNAGDGTVDGTVAGVVVSAADVSNVDFGVEEPPVATPGFCGPNTVLTNGARTVTVDVAAIAATDASGGVITSYHFSPQPTFSLGPPDGFWVESITINSVIYTIDFPPANTWPTDGVTVSYLTGPILASTYGPSSFNSGLMTMQIPYTVTDDAGQTASATAVCGIEILIQ